MFTLVVILVLLWLLLIVVAAAAQRVDNRPDVPGAGLVEVLNRVYARVFHGLRVSGREHMDAALAMRSVPGQTVRPMVVISNHKAGVDGLLVSAAVPFFIRWVMAADMKAPGLEPAYKFAGLIFVSREDAANKDLAGVREALRHLSAGHILGLFPEGRLCRHRGEIYPFQGGVGMLISRSRAIVLPMVLRESPVCQHAYSSLVMPSKSHIEVMPPVDFFAPGVPAMKGGEIAKRLEEMYVQWVGPVNYEPPRASAKA